MIAFDQPAAQAAPERGRGLLNLVPCIALQATNLDLVSKVIMKEPLLSTTHFA